MENVKILEVWRRLCQVMIKTVFIQKISEQVLHLEQSNEIQ